MFLVAWVCLSTSIPWFICSFCCGSSFPPCTSKDNMTAHVLARSNSMTFSLSGFNETKTLVLPIQTTFSCLFQPPIVTWFLPNPGYHDITSRFPMHYLAVFKASKYFCPPELKWNQRIPHLNLENTFIVMTFSTILDQWPWSIMVFPVWYMFFVSKNLLVTTKTFWGCCVGSIIKRKPTIPSVNVYGRNQVCESNRRCFFYGD